jgi:hypothetical protein
LQGRRVTALLLTAFLVAQLLWRWPFLSVAPASSADGGWSEVASGAYVAQGDLLLPYAQGQVLRRTGQGWMQARADWSTAWRGVRLEIYGRGDGQVAVARLGGAMQILPRYDGGFLLYDQQQNLWLVASHRVRLLLGGGRGQDGRDAFLARARTMRQQGGIPSGWQPVWAADPLPVGQAVWYLSNRDGEVGITPPHVFRLQGQADGPVATLTPLGNLDLLTAARGAVVAADASGALLRLDASSGTVLARRPGLFPLAVGPAGEMLVLQTASSGEPSLMVSRDGLKSLARLHLPAGFTATGQAAFSTRGHWLALLGREGRTTALAVVSLQGALPGDAQLIAPPAGVQVDASVPLSICHGVLYLATQQGTRLETWSRSLGGTESLALGIGRYAGHGPGHG